MEALILGTPEYMSPEQADLTSLRTSTPVRTSTALGVILYELLVGALPFDPKALRQAGFLEHPADDPGGRAAEAQYSTERRSARGRQSIRREQADESIAPRLRRERLRGDLDWITMKALEKDRTRRYGSPQELAADLRRHLKSEAVLASPPSALYRMGKFVRRHRLGVTAVGLVLLALVSGIGGTTYGLMQAKREAATSEQALKFLVGLFKVSDPSEARGNSITAREILDKGADRIEQELADQPVVQARLMNTMGRVVPATRAVRPSSPSGGKRVGEAAGTSG